MGFFAASDEEVLPWCLIIIRGYWWIQRERVDGHSGEGLEGDAYSPVDVTYCYNLAASMKGWRRGGGVLGRYLYMGLGVSAYIFANILTCLTRKEAYV